MTPSASIVFPTRRRAAYLDVALASVAPQAREHGAELVVVEDEAPYAATEAVAARHGARYLALGAPLGINAARNACVGATRSELVCFLDDDVEVWPGWLAALLAGAASCPGHEVFGGPIRARLEGFALRTCGREPPPITTLDLGSEDRDADFVWGANFALRRSAVERVGLFDPAINYCGDEEDWQRRVRAAGGRIRYLAAAGVDHRRAGEDISLRRLSRAAWFRGLHARRYDERKGTAPPLARELRTLAGCVWHAGRNRCANGVVLTAMSAGRLRSALAPGNAGRAAPPDPAGQVDAAAGTALRTQARGEAAAPADADFLSGTSGTLSRRGLARARLLDGAADAVTVPRRGRLVRAARRGPPRRVLAVGVARPQNAARVAALSRELRRSQHAVEMHFSEGAAGAGKWANLNAALRAHPAAGHEWLLLVDDDVSLPRGFLDAFLFCCEAFELTLAQPAHAYASHAAWPVTRRRPLALARETRFVEIGPVTAIHARAFSALLPFPPLRMGWGLDFHWSAVAASHGFKLGVVDATPIRHASPVASDYPHAEAVEEAQRFLDGRSRIERAHADLTVRRHTAWRQ